MGDRDWKWGSGDQMLRLVAGGSMEESQLSGGYGGGFLSPKWLQSGLIC